MLKLEKRSRGLCGDSNSHGLEICPSYKSWDLDTNLLRPRGNSAANQKITHCAGKVRLPSLPKINTG